MMGSICVTSPIAERRIMQIDSCSLLGAPIFTNIGLETSAMQIHEVSQHNTKFWVSDDVCADFNVNWFDEVQYKKSSKLNSWESGRQAISRLTILGVAMILRHYCRGGVPSRLTKDQFIFSGFRRCRCYQEMMLLNTMWQANLPVPKPIAAKCQRRGLFYKADLIMAEIGNTKTLAETLSQASLSNSAWMKIGQVIHQFHTYGIEHVDLNANNILIDSNEDVFLIDFDRCKQRKISPRWAEQGLKRLERSLEKEKARHHEMNYGKNMFLMLRKGYEG